MNPILDVERVAAIRKDWDGGNPVVPTRTIMRKDGAALLDSHEALTAKLAEWELRCALMRNYVPAYMADPIMKANLDEWLVLRDRVKSLEVERDSFKALSSSYRKQADSLKGQLNDLRHASDELRSCYEYAVSLIPAGASLAGHIKSLEVELRDAGFELREARHVGKHNAWIAGELRTRIKALEALLFRHPIDSPGWATDRNALLVGVPRPGTAPSAEKPQDQPRPGMVFACNCD